MGEKVEGTGARPPIDYYNKSNVPRGKMKGKGVSVIKNGGKSFGKFLKKAVRNTAAETARVAVREFGIHFTTGDADDWRIKGNTIRLIIRGEG